MHVGKIKVKINFYKSTILPYQVFIFNIKILNSYYQSTIDKNITNIAINQYLICSDIFFKYSQFNYLKDRIFSFVNKTLLHS